MAPSWPACVVAALALCSIVSATGNETYVAPKGSNVGHIIIDQPNPPACPSGCKGETGLDGPPGRGGRPGVRGPPGMPGIPGYNGWSTWAGWKENYRVQAVKGGRGPEGEVGPPGVDGKNGMPGSQGPSGPAGPFGQDGMPGPRGLPGSPGEAGTPGPGGPRGPRGADGAIGLMGLTGAKGVTGDLGEIGRSGAGGAKGEVGVRGDRGDRGPKGVDGERGLAGYSGEKGFKGNTGDQGIVGPDGAKGGRGDMGGDGAKGVTGMEGDTGETGDTGSQGATGEQGPYIEKIAITESDSCAAGNNGKVKFDPILKKLYFCDGNAWLCVKSQVCDEPCRVSEWGAYTACSATCGDATRMRYRYVTNRAGPNNNDGCPDLSETQMCTGNPACSCPDPGVPDNGYRLGNDFALLDTVQWQCDSGYIIDGATESICLINHDTGVPEFSARPVCRAIDCPRLMHPSNGRVTQSNPAVYNSMATFTCEAGYGVSNTTALRCTVSGLWNWSPPTCVPVTCPDPGTPANGARNNGGTTFSYGTSVSYSCNSGYLLAGTQTITCSASGAFSGTAPTCEAIDCGSLSNPDNGAVNVGATTYGSAASYQCSDGYSISGDVYRVCQANGQWSGSSPVCQLIDCGPLTSPDDGQVSMSGGTGLGAVATYSCTSGYLLSGHMTRECQRNNRWSGVQPTCVVVSCPDPGFPLNGGRTGDILTLGGVLGYTCANGYVMQGSASRSCMADGTLSGSQPTCEAVQCADLVAPVNGAVFQPSKSLHGHGYYSCDTGYTLAGPYMRRCMPSGAWNGSVPVCMLNTCPEPMSPEKGTAETLAAGSSSVDNAFMSVVDFRCNAGYWLRGSATRTCLECGSWSGSQPVCEPVACDSPETPKNGDRASANLTFESQVSYSCNDGFGLVGSENRMCGADGQWNTPAPQCEAVICEQLPMPANGFKRGDSVEFQAEVEFGCNTGYALLGSFKRSCQANAEWSGTQPVCRLVDCGDPGDVDQATRTGSSFTYNQEVSYLCGSGYILRGGATRRCQDNGDWSGSAPTCVIVTCGDPGTPSKGIRTGDNFDFGSRVRYACVSGYRVDGTRSRTCQADGMWSGSLPTCNAISCFDPGSPANGGRTLTRMLLADTVSYTCNTGYTMSQGGSPVRTCQLSIDGVAMWSGSMPTCEVVDCGRPRVPANGDLLGRDFTYLSAVSYSCNKGYALDGDSNRMCMASGSWSGEDPTCVEVNCGAPGSSSNGVATYASVNYDSVVTWTCNTGYTLAGASTATCQFNGQWSAPFPSCTIVSCGDPGTPANGALIGSDFTHGPDGVNYLCNAGYQMVGSASRLCQADGTWSGQAPLCVALYCVNPGVPRNGDWDIRSVITGASVNYTCNQGFLLEGTSNRACQISQDGLSASWTGALPGCAGVTCPQLTQPDDGTMTLTGGVRFESEARFTCNTGYVMAGSKGRVCQESGAWTGTQTTCNIVDCGVLDSPQSGSVSFVTTVYGSTARYGCRTGFNRVGLGQRVCRANGMWEGEAPTCVAISCGDPGLPVNGGGSSVSFNVGGTVNYNCDRGYNLVGASVITCQSDGSWSSGVPSCVALACPDPGTPVNGDRDITQNNVGSMVSYSCQSGYNPTGTVRRECVLSADGTSANWDGALPACVIVSCGQLSAPSNGQILGTDVPQWTVYRSEVRFTCARGYTRVGSASRTCQADGQWSGTQPTCQPVDCGAPDEPANSILQLQSSSYQSVATITCMSGYALSGTGERRCQENGLWSGASPVCDLVTCGDPGVPINGVRIGSVFTYGSDVLFECSPGYNMNGLQQVSCELNGRWSGAPPTCSLLDCEDPGTPMNGDRYMYRTTLGAQVNFTCNPGYSLVGNSFRMCLANEAGTSATWNNNVPNCIEITCADPGRPENGVRFDDGSGMKYGSETSYFCDTGYVVQGSSFARCMATGLWSAPRPTCVVVDCGQQTAPAFSTRTVTSTEYKGVATYTCNAGYAMLGSRTSTCQANGIWSTLPPVCLLIQCGDPGVPANGARTGDLFSFGARVSFTCNPGYRRVGSQASQCTANGLWSNPAPRCILMACADPERPVNGDRDFVTTSIGATVNYTCNTGFVLQGVESRTCRANSNGLAASWSSTLPSCEVVDCGNPGPLAGGSISASSFIYNMQASFSCNTGYNLAGSKLRTCLASGQWSGVATTCVLIDCGDPGNVVDGVRSGQATTYNSPVSFVCNDGYMLFGSQRRVCQANGLWSGQQPTCQIVDCGDPGTPSNGMKTLRTTTYGSFAGFSCNEGYEMVGSSRRECMASGQWSGTQPVCNAIICSDPGTPVNGGRDGSSLMLASTVTYFCNPGYTLVGSQQRTCQSNRRFDGSLPICQVVVCDNPGKPENGDRAGNDFTFTSQVSFSCNPGYTLSGSRMRICMADGTWSGTPAACTLVTCPVPTAPVNGVVSRSPSQSLVYQTVASYTCDRGYKLIGAMTRTCQANGDWSLSTPECQLITCCEQTAPTNGAMTGTDFTFEKMVGFQCDDGFMLRGSEQRQCQSDGSWTGQPPACEPRFCADPGTIENGIRTEISLAVGGIAAFQCNTGYRLEGQARLTCLSSGSWSHPLPGCIVDVCPNPGVPLHGSRIGDIFSVGSSVNFQCDAGYVLNGALTLNCLSSASWDTVRPTCDPDCQVSQWTEWSACSVTCLDGVQTRSRDITQEPSGIGALCPTLADTTPCSLRDDCGCGNYPLGSIHASIRQEAQDVATDVIIVVDESSSMGIYHAWLSSTISLLDNAFLADGIGSSPELRNHYALVGFGRDPIGDDVSPVLPRAFIDRTGRKVFDIDSYAYVNNQLQEGGNIEDGYLAIQYALRNITDASGNNLLRLGQQNVATNIIFITDEERDVFSPYGSGIDRSSIKRLIRRSGAVLNVVVDQEFFGGNRRAFGLDSEKIAYIVEEGGQYSNSTNSRTGVGYLTTKRDYTTVALELGGAAWDIKILRQGGSVGASFTSAFLRVKTQEVQRQIDQCRDCLCQDNGRTAQLVCNPAGDQVKCKAEALAGRG